jgi:hypothetical protein
MSVLNLQCAGGKFTYPDHNTALRVAHQMNRANRRTGRTARKVTTYHCPGCRGYHVTNHNLKQKWN